MALRGRVSGASSLLATDIPSPVIDHVQERGPDSESECVDKCMHVMGREADPILVEQSK